MKFVSFAPYQPHALHHIFLDFTLATPHEINRRLKRPQLSWVLYLNVLRSCGTNFQSCLNGIFLRSGRVHHG